jgi:cold shock protein
MSKESLQGVVKWFNREKGFGFLVADKKQYFVHYKEIAMQGFKELKEGQQVCFTTRDTERGVCAENVRVIDEINH